MEQVHGVDVSWMTKTSSKDKANKTSSTPSKPTPAPSQPRTIPVPAQDARNPQGTPDAKGVSPQPNGHLAPPSPANATGIGRRLSRSGSVDSKNYPNGTSPQRRNTWFSNISAKFSSSTSATATASAVSPPPGNVPTHQHSQHFLHHKESNQQQGEDQLLQSSSQPQSPGSPPPVDGSEPLPPRLHPTRNAVLQHAAAKPDGNGPYTPAPPKSSQAGFLGVFRRLSSSGANAAANGKLGNGLVERKVLNVDQNRERCTISELKEAKLRRVSFCVDVEIAPLPKYSDGEAQQAKPLDKAQKKKLTEKAEGDALKHPQTIEAKKEAEEAQDIANPVDGDLTTTSTTENPAAGPNGTNGAANDEGTGADKETNKKKEKKKRSEEERKARKEKRRRLAEDNGSVPIEIHYENSDESSDDAQSDTVAPKSSSHPTRNPARIYRRCCQLRETPILKKITAQLMDTHNANVSAGTVAKLDLTDYYLQLPDLITLGDYLAIVPVKEIIMENCGLSDEGLRVILAGLLAAKMPPTSRRKKPKHELEPQGGLVELVVIKNNKFGPDGWKHISLFLYKCRSLKSLDISHIPFPRQAPTLQNCSLPNGIQIPRTISDVFSTAIANRLGGSTLEMVNMGETEPSMEQLGTIMDGMIKCGVRRLGLAHNSLNAEGMKHVVKYLAAGVCEGLDLGGNDISEHLETLASCFVEGHPMWALGLAGCNLTPQTLGKILPALTKMKGFRFIDLSHNHDLFSTKPSALGLLRKYLPKFENLKRIHLQDVNMSSEQAIALVEVLPEVRTLAHINMLGNSELMKLADAKSEEAQEEACALYASLMAAARISSSLICVDIEVPSEESGEIVKAMAKQVVAYCLRNMERMPDTNIGTAAASVMTDTKAEVQDGKVPGYPDVLAHLVGHDVLENDGPEDEHDSTPDEDYVIGGTGVVKALACCLKNRSEDSGRQSGEFVRGKEGADNDTSATAGLPTGGKAKDMSKHLLAGARKIRQRLQPALHKAQRTPGDEMNLRKLVFLDNTLQGIIKRFEDEYPDTRESGPDTPPDDALRKISSLSSEEPSHSAPVGDDSAVAVSDGEEESAIHARKAVSRSNSMLSKELEEEEGRTLRVGHRFRSGFVGQEQLDRIGNLAEFVDGRHLEMLEELAEDIGGEMLEKVKEKGVMRAFQEDRELLYRCMRDSDPEHFTKFLESQQKARANITVPSPGEKHGAGYLQLVNGSAISD